MEDQLDPIVKQMIVTQLRSQLGIQKVILNYEKIVAAESQFTSKTFFYKSAAEKIIIEIEAQLKEILLYNRLTIPITQSW